MMPIRSSVFLCGTLLFLSAIIRADIIAYDGDYETETFLDSEWPLSQPVEKKGIEGVMVGASPSDACSNISLPPDINCSCNWFVLIAGNSCTYDTKVYYAQLAGYSAAVIYNLGPKDFARYKKHSKQIYPFPNISAVVVRTTSGLILKEKYLYTIDKRWRVFIFPNNSFNIIKFLLLFAIVAGGVFVIVVLAFMIVRCVQQSRRIHSNRLSSRHLRQLTTSKYKKGDPYDMCAICLEDYNERDNLRILPCLHGYHTKCIDPWLTNNKRICPICKQRVILAGEISENDTESDTESRAETAPLLRNGRNYMHGTFSGVRSPPATNFVYNPNSHTEDAGETTSRDVTSDALDDTSDEEQTYSPTVCPVDPTNQRSHSLTENI